jgi:hypothetical protein
MPRSPLILENLYHGIRDAGCRVNVGRPAISHRVGAISFRSGSRASLTVLRRHRQHRPPERPQGKGTAMLAGMDARWDEAKGKGL